MIAVLRRLIYNMGMGAMVDQHVLDEVLEPVGSCLTPEVARRIADLRAGAATQARLDQLADKSTQGSLSADEAAEYHTYVTAINFLGILQSKARAILRQPGKA